MTIKCQTSHTSVGRRLHRASLSIQPPPTTKAQLGPTDSCTILPLWLTQLGFSSFIFYWSFNLLLCYFRHKSLQHQVGPLLFVSNSARHFSDFVIELHLCDGRPEALLAELRGKDAARTTDDVTLPSAGSVYVILPADRKRAWAPFKIIPQSDIVCF